MTTFLLILTIYILGALITTFILAIYSDKTTEQVTWAIALWPLVLIISVFVVVYYLGKKLRK